ncbi:MAG: Gfo/Idh/MocA family oxidoreductase, partial [Actinomyces ruminicola]|nr:Gfo/Idh/MocA family oxidoreductase [Actinomyces ruminicola]
MSKKLRIGIVGLGFIGTQKHLVGLAQHKDKCEIVAFCDFDIERAEAGKAQWGNEDAYTTTDYKDLVNDDSIDVIHVCTWNANHCEITCAALEAGKHVMVEKPMAVTGEDARKMRDTAKRTGKKLTVG